MFSDIETYAHLIKPYSDEEKEWLIDLFETTSWDMLTILNTWHACDYSKAKTEQVLRLASQCAVHPGDVTSLFKKNVIG